MKPIPRRIVLGAAAVVLLLTSLYASQALKKLDRAVGEKVTLKVCRFECFCERNPFMGMNLPIPTLTCTVVLPKGAKVLDWQPGENTWFPRQA